uniref:Serine/threonine-protein kinase D n=1 Tax=Talaromyces marneffei PM1 TaxID=1077442 RepID=A0A093UUL1_TALMA
MDKSPDYKSLYQQAERARLEAESARLEAESARLEAESARLEAERKRLEADKERVKAQEERTEAERKRNVAEQAKEQIEAERNLLKSETQPTTFLEFIETCHVHISQPLRVETNKTRSTGGSLTSPKGRLCPTYLRPWKTFHEQQTEIYETVIRLLQSSSKHNLFSSKSSIHDLGRRLYRRPFASEEDLRGYQRYGVEDQAQEIIDVLRSVSDMFPLGEGIDFDNHANTFDDEDATSTKVDRRRKRSIPDQFCVFRKGAEHDLLFPMEYKARHKLSDEFLRAGLRPMEFWKEVVQRPTIPVEGGERLSYHADLLTGSGLVHMYDPMMLYGAKYGCLTTGSCQVFLHIPESDPDTLEYYLAEPNLDVQAMRDKGDNAWMTTPVTAVGRLLTLCLMSLQSPVRSQRWRNEVIPRLHQWEVDFEYILSQIPDDEMHSSPPGSEYLPSSPLVSSSKKSRERLGCRPDEVQDSRSSDEPDSDDAPQDPNLKGRKRALTLSSPPQRQHRSGQQYRRDDRSSQESMDFCTQGCLLSLKKGGRLDENCPNVARHRKADIKCHPIHFSEFSRLLKQQLDNDLDHFCIPCGEPGTCGAPFKITLMPFGYTILGKGTTERRWSVVRREEEVYQVLHSIQGSAIPILLGTVDINWTYFYRRAKITHFLVLSWAGYAFDLRCGDERQWNEYQRTKKEIQALGVVHGDLHESNIRWNRELNRVQIIDFHKAILSTTKKRNRESRNSSPPRKRISPYHRDNGLPIAT